MIADIKITEKSFGAKQLMTNVNFSVDDGEKVGVIGRNGIGKSTLFSILTGTDKDFSGEIIFRRGTVVVSTAQEHHGVNDDTVMQYILSGLPEYKELSHIITTYPETMGDDMKKINLYTESLQRFSDKGFYYIEEQLERELDNFQLSGLGNRALSTLSGGQKRLVEVVKIMHAQSQLALVDEPTNHMDYVAKQQFVDWIKSAKEAVLVITHDRDVLKEVDRIIELKDGTTISYKGNYDDYLRQNTTNTGAQMDEFVSIEKRIKNLKEKVIDYQRLKEKARNPSTIQKFKRLEMVSRQELAELEQKEKPTFWIDKQSASQLNYKVASNYDKFKTKNIRLKVSQDDSRSKHTLIQAKNLQLGYGDAALFGSVSFALGEGESLELRGRNGAGKTTLIKYILGRDDSIKKISGESEMDKNIRVGIYDQEISPEYFKLPLIEAIERIYLDQNLPISDTKVRQLMSDYLFTEADNHVPVERLSGGQKARLQLIRMLSSDPQLLILDEPTNHLDLPSIEELESALVNFSGATLYVSHDGYFRSVLGGDVVEIK